MRALSRNLLLSFLATSLCQTVSAAPKAALVWRDGKGIESLENCRIGSQEQIGLRVISETDLTVKGLREGLQLRDRSLVKVLKTNPQSTYIQLIGIAQNSHIQSTAKSAQALDEGVVATQKTALMDDYVLEIQDHAVQQKLGGSFLQVAMQDGHYAVMACGVGRSVKKFNLYNVFNAHNTQPIGQIGVTEDETQLFKSVRVFTSDEATQLLNHLNMEAESSNFRSDVHNGGSFAAGNGGAKNKGTGSAGSKTSAIPQNHLTATFPLNIKSNEKENGKETQNLKENFPAPEVPTEAPVDLTQMTPMLAATSGSAIDSVVCLTSGTLSVRDDSLKVVLFQANKLETVKVVQSFKVPNDPRYIKVQFNGRPAGKNTGLVAKEYIQLKTQCAMTRLAVQAKTQATNQTAANLAKGNWKSVLDSDNCCNFPTHARPTMSYKQGMRQYGWNRSGGKRKHAACDLYRDKGDPVSVILDGMVLRDKYLYYGGVFAIEVIHTGGIVVNYGEVLGKNAPGISRGAKLSKGQTVGYVGQVGGHGKLNPMLHFELYKGTETGPLKHLELRPFQRRSDLINATNYLSDWEKAKFGASY